VVAEGGIEITRETGDRWAHGMMLNLLAGVRLWQGRTREALDLSAQAHKLFVEMGDAIGLGMSTMQLAWAFLFTGRGKEALELFEAQGETPKTIAPRAPFPLAVATFRTLLGEGDAAVSFLDEVGVTEDTDDPDLLAMRALALLVADRVEEAYACASRGWTYDPQDTGTRANVACVYALVAAAAGRPQEAVTVGDEVGRIGGTYLDQTRAHLGRAFGHAALGAGVEARAAMDSARRIADTTDDVLTKALVELAEAILLFESVTMRRPQPAGTHELAIEAARRLEELGVKWHSWDRIFRLAATAGARQ
jgi:hypothetical protein